MCKPNIFILITNMHLEVSLTFRLDHVKELLAIFLVDESVVENPVNLVAPESDQLVRVSQVGAVTKVASSTNKCHTFYCETAKPFQSAILNSHIAHGYG